MWARSRVHPLGAPPILRQSWQSILRAGSMTGNIIAWGQSSQSVLSPRIPNRQHCVEKGQLPSRVHGLKLGWPGRNPFNVACTWLVCNLNILLVAP